MVGKYWGHRWGVNMRDWRTIPMPAHIHTSHLNSPSRWEEYNNFRKVHRFFKTVFYYSSKITVCLSVCCFVKGRHPANVHVVLSCPVMTSWIQTTVNVAQPCHDKIQHGMTWNKQDRQTDRHVNWNAMYVGLSFGGRCNFWSKGN